ncbi:hypothetical protein N1031_03335 [Herbiconiux moechotypicola]|uniref:hypothetical protein n=1 Tax=Herbiconiux moechotypicola TaxID=637393 RepID=UPI00217D0D21|nr:hypothetical protein [Herbiconiux moechotypicola]MCS5728782.1 hypothetical protein [Herbiconiux moechotypicola]
MSEKRRARARALLVVLCFAMAGIGGLGALVLAQSLPAADWPEAVRAAITTVGGAILLGVVIALAVTPVLVAARRRDSSLARRYTDAVVFGFAAGSPTLRFLRRLERLDGEPAERFLPRYYTVVADGRRLEFWYGWSRYRRIFAVRAEQISSIEPAIRYERGATFPGIRISLADPEGDLFVAPNGAGITGMSVLKKSDQAPLLKELINGLLPG